MISIGWTILIITLNMNAVINKSEWLTDCAVTCINLKNMLSERNQIKKTTFLEISTKINGAKIKLIGMFFTNDIFSSSSHECYLNFQIKFLFIPLLFFWKLITSPGGITNFCSIPPGFQK